ncbi:MAG TPA: ribonuclease H-like domain-containing protein [Candidatus Paceibacterota bacterium]|nr:ribonuclease H-like domain-containing protein [Candidatus Paceibacterota bacterium]
MRAITFDIETANWITDTGSNGPADLTIAIVCIHDSETGEYSSYLENELPRLWPILERADLLIGYNSDHFDIPLLNKYYPGDLSKIKSLDIMVEVQKAIGRRLKLDTLAEGTLNDKKLDGKGGQSLVWWRAGEVEKVREYCIHDVKLTRDLFDYAMKNGVLKYKELGKLREVKLDTTQWLTTAGAPMTFTLGL